MSNDYETRLAARAAGDPLPGDADQPSPGDPMLDEFAAAINVLKRASVPPDPQRRQAVLAASASRPTLRWWALSAAAVILLSIGLAGLGYFVGPSPVDQPIHPITLKPQEEPDKTPQETPRETPKETPEETPEETRPEPVLPHWLKTQLDLVAAPAESQVTADDIQRHIAQGTAGGRGGRGSVGGSPEYDIVVHRPGRLKDALTEISHTKVSADESGLGFPLYRSVFELDGATIVILQARLDHSGVLEDLPGALIHIRGSTRLALLSDGLDRDALTLVARDLLRH